MANAFRKRLYLPTAPLQHYDKAAERALNVRSNSDSPTSRIRMRAIHFVPASLLSALIFSCPAYGQKPPSSSPPAGADAAASEAAARSDMEQAKKAGEWVASLKLA